MRHRRGVEMAGQANQRCMKMRIEERRPQADEADQRQRAERR